MKLTTQQIKEIINEELENLQNEGFFGDKMKAAGSYMKDLAGQIGHSIKSKFKKGLADDEETRYSDAQRAVANELGKELELEKGASAHELELMLRDYTADSAEAQRFVAKMKKDKTIEKIDKAGKRIRLGKRYKE